MAEYDPQEEKLNHTSEFPLSWFSARHFSSHKHPPFIFGFFYSCSAHDATSTSSSRTFGDLPRLHSIRHRSPRHFFSPALPVRSPPPNGDLVSPLVTTWERVFPTAIKHFWFRCFERLRSGLGKLYFLHYGRRIVPYRGLAASLFPPLVLSNFFSFL